MGQGAHLCVLSLHAHHFPDLLLLGLLRDLFGCC